MIRSEFMKKLEQSLAELSPSERQEAIDYYYSYMDDAGIGINDAVPESIGTPEEVAKELKRSILNPDTDFIADEKTNKNVPGKTFVNQNKGNNSGKKKINGSEVALIAIIAVITSPIWFSLIISVFAVAVAICATIFALVFAFGVTAICLGIVGIALIATGASILFAGSVAGAGVIGAGLIITAIGIVVLVAILNCVVIFFPWLIRSIEKLIKKFRKKEAL